METKSLKSLSMQLLQGNLKGNPEETNGFQRGKLTHLSSKEEEYYRLFAEFESYSWLDGQPLPVIEEHYPRLQELVIELDQLYRELNKSE